MSNGEYPVEPEVTVALLRLERRLIERLARLETKVDALSPPPSAGTTRAATAGAVAAGAIMGVAEALRRFIG